MLSYEEPFVVVASIGYVVILAFALLIYNIFKDKDIKVKKNVLNVISAIIVLLELLKQIQNIIPGIDYGSLWFKNTGGNEFSTYALPFHLCSFFIFWPIVAFFTKGKVKDFFENLTGVWGGIIFFATTFYPDVIYGGALRSVYSGGELTHTVVFHLMVCLYFLVMMALKPFNFSLKKVWYAPIGVLIYGAVASPFAFLFKENYCSIYEPHSFGFTVEVFNNFGYGLYLPLIALMGCAAATVFYLVIVGVNKLCNILNCPKGLFIGFCALEILILPFANMYRLYCNGNTMLYVPLFIVLMVAVVAASILLLKFYEKKKAAKVQE